MSSQNATTMKQQQQASSPAAPKKQNVASARLPPPAAAASANGTPSKQAAANNKSTATTTAAGSPVATSPSGSSLARSTRASEAMKDAKSPNAVGVPSHVEHLASQSPSERIKAEQREKRQRSRSACAPSRGFNSSAERMTFTAEKQVHAVNLNSPRLGAQKRTMSPARASARRKADTRLVEAQKEGGQRGQDNSAWARSKAAGNRHSFQRKFPAVGFPTTAPDSTAPGPGAYGASTSYVA